MIVTKKEISRIARLVNFLVKQPLSGSALVVQRVPVTLVGTIGSARSAGLARCLQAHVNAKIMKANGCTYAVSV